MCSCWRSKSAPGSNTAMGFRMDFAWFARRNPLVLAIFWAYWPQLLLLQLMKISQYLLGEALRAPFFVALK